MKTIDQMLSEVAAFLKVQQPALAPAPALALAADSKIKPKQGKRPMEAPEKTAVISRETPKKLCMGLNLAKEVSYAIEKMAEQMELAVVVSVVDAGANLVLLHAMDDAYIASSRAAQDKAYTAAALKMPTHQALAMSRGGELDGLTNGNGILLLAGGYPLTAGDRQIGAVGVSGGSVAQDQKLAAFGAAYVQTKWKQTEKSEIN